MFYLILILLMTVDIEKKSLEKNHDKKEEKALLGGRDTPCLLIFHDILK